VLAQRGPQSCQTSWALPQAAARRCHAAAQVTPLMRCHAVNQDTPLCLVSYIRGTIGHCSAQPTPKNPHSSKL
jgi:hypothetical protein